MITDRSFQMMFARTDGLFRTQASEVHTARWQGQDISKRPDMVSYELMNWHCEINLGWLAELYSEDEELALDGLRSTIKPNLPWADDHFLERAGGEPLNPGLQWANWPWAASADRHRTDQAFNHTYMERLWPKWAGMTPGGYLLDKEGNRRAPLDKKGNTLLPIHSGIRHTYGDLEDLVHLLAKEPDTRQAWIPLFFPEDTGVGDGGRKPCTLGYQFLVRDKRISMYYPLRSCDYIRHFRDDIYLAIRLLLWVVNKCRELNPAFWQDVLPGYYAMHATSLHVFANDYRELFR